MILEMLCNDRKLPHRVISSVHPPPIKLFSTVYPLNFGEMLNEGLCTFFQRKIVTDRPYGNLLSYLSSHPPYFFGYYYDIGERKWSHSGCLC